MTCMSGIVKRVPGPSFDLLGIIPNNGYEIAVPENTTSITVIVDRAKLTPTVKRNWGFRLGTATEIKELGSYAQVHSRMSSGVTSVSSDTGWLPCGENRHANERWSGKFNFELAGGIANFWSYYGYLGQEEDIPSLSIVETQRQSGGSAWLDAPLTRLVLWGGSTDQFTAGRMDVVFYTTIP